MSGAGERWHLDPLYSQYGDHVLDEDDLVIATVAVRAHAEQIVADHNEIDTLRARLAASEARVRELEALIAEALPLMEDEWIGTGGPILFPGSGGEWIVKARSALDAALRGAEGDDAAERP